MTHAKALNSLYGEGRSVTTGNTAFSIPLLLKCRFRRRGDLNMRQSKMAGQAKRSEPRTG